MNPFPPANDIVFPKGPPSWPPQDRAILELIQQAWRDGSWSVYEGRWTQSLVEVLRSRFQVAHVRLTSSGTIAVEIALRGLGVSSGDEVILAAYDFPGNFRAVESIGARPVLVDVAAQGWTLDPQQLDAAFSPRVKAIVVSHLHGQLAPITTIRKWAQAHDLAVLEDACQVPGAEIEGRPAGSWGDAGVLSFGGSKLLSAGRGGAVITMSAEIAQRMTIFAERGNDAFPLSQLQAASLLPQLDQLQTRNSTRRDRAARLHALLAHEAAFQLPSQGSDTEQTTYYKFGFFLSLGSNDSTELRKAFIAEATRQGLAIGEGFRGFFLRPERRCRKVGQLPQSRRAAEATVLLHHPILLEPDPTPDLVAEALHRAATEL